LKFKQNLKIYNGLSEICFVPALNLAFLLFLLIIVASGFLVSPRITVKLPKVITSDKAEEKKVTVLITAENLIYFHNRLYTARELREEFKKNLLKGYSVLIKADRRASLGQVVEIWNLCRELGLEEVNIASTP